MSTAFVTSLLGAAAPAQAATGDLVAGWSAANGTTVPAASGPDRMVFQTDGNLVIYNGRGAAVWTANTAGSGAKKVTFQADGNLVLYTADGRAVWASGTNGSAATRLTLQADGNLVLYTTDGRPVWATGALHPEPALGAPVMSAGQALYAGDYLTAPGGKYVLRQQPDGSLQLSGPGGPVWTSAAVGSGPATHTVMQDDGNLVSYDGLRRVVWASDTAGAGSVLTVGDTGSFAVSAGGSVTGLFPRPNGSVLLDQSFTSAAGTKPDSAMWSYNTGRWGDKSTYYTSSNAVTDGAGNLVVATRRGDNPDTTSTSPYTGSRMTTQGKFGLTVNSRLSITAKVPASGSGQWPALWLLGNNPANPNDWPEEGEIDLMETRTSHPAFIDAAHVGTFMFQTVHGPGNTTATAHTDEPLGFSPRWNSNPPTPDLSSRFWTYTLTWTPTQITMTLSDPAAPTVPPVVTFSVTKARFEAAGGDWTPFSGAWPMSLLVSNGVDAAFLPTGDPGAAPMLVKSIQAWRLNAS